MKLSERIFLTPSLALLLILSSGCLPQRVVTPTPTPIAAPPEVPPSPAGNGWTPPPLSGGPLLPSIADVVAQVRPSVVAINTRSIGYDFFNRPAVQEGAGSGWILREDGTIVTNNHVVEGATNINVTLADGRTFSADLKTVATDPLTDLAVLKISTNGLPPAPVGDSGKLRVGDWVVAIGNSLGLGISAKEGIVSRLGVSLTISDQTLYELLETSAAINPGNSGGPLVNMAGEVIGITSAKIASSGVEGMGYAISIQEALPVIQQLVNTGYVVRPWLGIGLYTVDQLAIAMYSLSVDKGVLVVNVGAGSPADKAGLQGGDVITRFGDTDITTDDELTRAIHSAQIGQTVDITFWRGQTMQTTPATLAQTPPPAS
ncbi:MAG: trypsin-like peptidase domain-containing protein [Chloroflexota bacterium]